MFHQYGNEINFHAHGVINSIYKRYNLHVSFGQQLCFYRNTPSILVDNEKYTSYNRHKLSKPNTSYKPGS
jgi:hypothetical protein